MPKRPNRIHLQVRKRRLIQRDLRRGRRHLLLQQRRLHKRRVLLLLRDMEPELRRLRQRFGNRRAMALQFKCCSFGVQRFQRQPRRQFPGVCCLQVRQRHNSIPIRGSGAILLQWCNSPAIHSVLRQARRVLLLHCGLLPILHRFRDSLPRRRDVRHVRVLRQRRVRPILLRHHALQRNFQPKPDILRPDVCLRNAVPTDLRPRFGVRNRDCPQRLCEMLRLRLNRQLLLRRSGRQLPDQRNLRKRHVRVAELRQLRHQSRNPPLRLSPALLQELQLHRPDNSRLPDRDERNVPLDVADQRRLLRPCLR